MSEAQNLNQKPPVNLFHQVVCEKHEYVLVTLTTTKKMENTVIELDEKSWMQCKKCGKKNQYAELLA